MVTLKLFYVRLFFIVAANAKQARFVDILYSLADLVKYYRVDWVLAGQGSVQYVEQIASVFDHHEVLYDIIVNNYHATFYGLFYYKPNQYVVWRDLQALKTDWCFTTKSGTAGCPPYWTNWLFHTV